MFKMYDLQKDINVFFSLFSAYTLKLAASVIGGRHNDCRRRANQRLL